MNAPKERIIQRAAEIVFENRTPRAQCAEGLHLPWCCCFALDYAAAEIAKGEQQTQWFTRVSAALGDEFSWSFGCAGNAIPREPFFFGRKTTDKTQSERALALLFFKHAMHDL